MFLALCIFLLIASVQGWGAGRLGRTLILLVGTHFLVILALGQPHFIEVIETTERTHHDSIKSDSNNHRTM